MQTTLIQDSARFTQGHKFYPVQVTSAPYVFMESACSYSEIQEHVLQREVLYELISVSHDYSPSRLRKRFTHNSQPMYTLMKLPAIHQSKRQQHQIHVHREMY